MVPILSSLVTQKVFVMTTYGITTDDKVGIMMIPVAPFTNMV